MNEHCIEHLHFWERDSNSYYTQKNHYYFKHEICFEDCCRLKQANKNRDNDAALAYALLAKEVQHKVGNYGRLPLQQLT